MFGIKTRLKRGWKVFKYTYSNLSVPHTSDLDALLLCHALEKGMGTQNVRHGFGQEKANNLAEILNEMKKNGQIDSFAFQESLAILNTYLEFQRNDGVNLQKLQQKLTELNKSFYGDCNGGVYVGKETEFLIGTSIDFPSFVKSRHSMRTYSDEPVTNEEILQAIELAKAAPSACNRQPWRVYYSFDETKIDAIRNSVPPQAFLQDTPYFCLITVDRSLFGGPEINQWFINGGIFASFFILALHHLGIGSVVLEFNMFRDEEAGLRRSLSIKDTDEIIAVIGFGKYPKEAKCICAQRRSNKEIAILR